MNDRFVRTLAGQSREFSVRTDAYDVRPGMMLGQHFEDGVLPIAYASRKPFDRDKVHSVTETECLGLVRAVRISSVFLYGHGFLLQTDHQPWVYLDWAKFENDRVMRWTLLLRGYHFCIGGCGVSAATSSAEHQRVRSFVLLPCGASKGRHNVSAFSFRFLCSIDGSLAEQTVSVRWTNKGIRLGKGRVTGNLMCGIHVCV